MKLTKKELIKIIKEEYATAAKLKEQEVATYDIGQLVDELVMQLEHLEQEAESEIQERKNFLEDMFSLELALKDESDLYYDDEGPRMDEAHKIIVGLKQNPYVAQHPMIVQMIERLENEIN